MADRFDWKKVLKTPFSRQEDRSAEVLFLPTEVEGRPTASFDTLSSRTTPQPGPAPEVEPKVEYQPPAPLVLPPDTKLNAWGEDAFSPAELESLNRGPVEVAGAIPPVLDDPAPVMAPLHAAEPAPAPEQLTPIQVNTWQTQVAPVPYATPEPQSAPLPAHEPEPEPMDMHEEAKVEVSIPASFIAIDEPLEEPPHDHSEPEAHHIEPEAHHADPEAHHVEATEPAPTEESGEPHAEAAASSLAASTKQTDDLLARFGVQRAAPKANNAAPAEAASPELLGDLERLLAGMNSENAKPLEDTHPAPAGEAQTLVAAAPEAAHPAVPAASADLEALLQSLQPTDTPAESHPHEAAAPAAEPTPELEELSRAEPDFKWADLVAKESVPDLDHHARELPAWQLAESLEADAPAAHLIEPEAPIEAADPTEPEPEAMQEHEPAATKPEAPLDEHAHFDIAAMLTRAAANRGTDFLRVGPIGDTCPVWFRTAGYFEHVHDFTAEEGRGIWSWFITHANAVESDDQPGRFSFAENTKVSVGFARDGAGDMLVAHIGKARSGPQELASIGLDSQEEKAVASAAASMHGLIVVSAPAGQSVRPMIEGVVACWNKAGRQTAWLGLPPQDLNANVLSAQPGSNPADSLASLMAAETECLAIDDLASSDLADLASHAVIQGRLVCVGVTAADGWSALARLSEFGVSPYLMSSAVRGIVSCRSVRALCPECKCSQPLDDEKKAKCLAVMPDALLGKVWTAPGCEKCHSTGYQGFTTLYEVVKVDEEASRLIALRSGPASFRAHFARAGQKSMAQAAVHAVLAGRTNWEEVEGFLGV